MRNGKKQYIRVAQYRAITVTDITIGEVSSNGGIDTCLKGAPSDWKIQSLVLPPCENIRLAFGNNGRIAVQSKNLLKYMRKIIYLATDPAYRIRIYHRHLDLVSRRHLNLVHHTLNSKDENMLARLIHFENILLGTMSFFEQKRGGGEMASMEASRHANCASLLKFAQLSRRENKVDLADLHLANLANMTDSSLEWIGKEVA